MENKYNHIGSIISRILLIADLNTSSKWNGMEENENGVSDYDLLDDDISYREGDISLFKKSIDLYYYVFFSFSTKTELFTNDSGFLILDGLLFNQSWDYSKDFEVKEIKTYDFELNVISENVVIFEATEYGAEMKIQKETGMQKIAENYGDYCYLKVTNNIYTIKKVEVKLILDNDVILLKGIEFAIKD